MNNSVKINFLNVLFWVLIFICIGLFCTMHFFKFNPDGSIGYASVACCCAVCVLTLLISKNKVNFWLAVGLLFTLFADTFLVLMQSQQTLAMFLFSVTQISYFVVLYYINQDKKQLILNLILRAGLFVVLCTTAWIMLGSAFSLLVLVSLFYFSNLLFNVIFSGINIKKCPLLFCGLLLFLLCDLLIGLEVLTGIINVPVLENVLSVLNAYFNLAWVFYIPSQLLITLSAINFAKGLTLAKA